MPKEFIVAIELGSSKITGVAGRRNSDGSISVLALAQEDSRQCIHKGMVYNIDKTVLTINTVVKRLETMLKTHIAKVYVGVGGQSVHSEKNVINKEFDIETRITAEIVDAMRDENSNTTYVEQELLYPTSQEFMVDAQSQLDPVGIQCKTLKANFLNILCRKSYYRNLNKCFEAANLPVAEMYLAPVALADSVLSETEKRSGCILVDLGGETTTVAVYYKNILRHLAVIPLGGNNITKDLAVILQIDEEEAERLKLKYGVAYADPKNIKDSDTIQTPDGRQIDVRKFNEIVEARVDEIVENVSYQVPSEFSSSLMSGIVLTGGGSNMENIDVAFRNHTHISKIRFAKFVNFTINSSRKDINTHDGTLCTVLGILAKGDQNCAGEPLSESLFENNKEGEDAPLAPHSVGETPNEGAVLTEAAKQKAAEEDRKRKEEEQRKAEEEERKRREQEEEERRKNAPLNKFKRSAKNFFHKIMEEGE